MTKAMEAAETYPHGVAGRAGPKSPGQMRLARGTGLRKPCWGEAGNGLGGVYRDPRQVLGVRCVQRRISQRKSCMHVRVGCVAVSQRNSEGWCAVGCWLLTVGWQVSGSKNVGTSSLRPARLLPWSVRLFFPLWP